MTVVSGPRRLRLARPATAWLLGGILLALAIAAAPLSRLAHQSLNASNGSVPVWIDDRHFRVDAVEFVYSGDDSTVDRFCIRKPRRLVEATVELVRHLEAPRIFELGIARGGSFTSNGTSAP